ncbi:sialate O-acetylesterase, partial [Akkermansiaceae bacterium]|nr:sialate O-acetylesterase [Akkermansiaceae bacterium]
MHLLLFAFALSLVLVSSASGRTINVDFSRDVSGPNPGTNQTDVLATSPGIAPDTGTVWNDFSINLSGAGSTVPSGDTRSNLVDSTGTATTVDISLTGGFYRAFNPANTTNYNGITREWVFAQNGVTATIAVDGLAANASYDFYLIVGGTFGTTFTINGSTGNTTGNPDPNIGNWVEGIQYVKITGTADGSGSLDIVLTDNNTATNAAGAISGMQIVESAALPVQFLYADGVTSTGGQFNANYPPDNLVNNGFTSPTDTIDTTIDYIAAGNNYASASGSTSGFSLTFDFDGPAELDGMHVWNYAYRNGSNGSTSPSSGVNACTLSLFDGPGGTGTQIGSSFSVFLAEVPWGAANPAETVAFPTTFSGVRSVVLQVDSNHGGTFFTGMNELAFNGTGAPLGDSIVSFTPSAPFVQKPALPALSWEVSGTITSLEISNSEEGTIDVSGLTTDGLGSLEVSPLGDQTYTLTLNGTIQQTLQVGGLPIKEKLHIYLLIGQSNMQGASGAVSPSNPVHAPVPRIVKFGSRVGMEQQFVTGGHPLISLAWTPGSAIGMGLEFGKTLLAAETDPEVVICLINHALGTTAIQYWEPDAIAQDGSTLYNNAVQRATDASQYGVVKGVLWHQGEYNANAAQTNPSPEPELYATRLQALVDNLRNDLGNPSLPFVGGKLSPSHTFSGDRTAIEAALADLPNQRTNTSCVDNAGLSGKAGDTIHFDEASQLLLGQRYA